MPPPAKGIILSRHVRSENAWGTLDTSQRHETVSWAHTKDIDLEGLALALLICWPSKGPHLLSARCAVTLPAVKGFIHHLSPSLERGGHWLTHEWQYP